jgi:hypothetical protein
MHSFKGRVRLYDDVSASRHLPPDRRPESCRTTVHGGERDQNGDQGSGGPRLAERRHLTTRDHV